jgi:tRNA pseudouridine55 synthase
MPEAMLGIVNLDKPVGPTSHDMVGLMRRLTGTRRIGHAGTLDPLASGVLPILVGAATRFSEELTGGAKRYEAVIRLGWRSETDDAQGPLARGGALPTDTEAESALRAFVGTFEQRPPAFSARKVGGQTAYRAARGGSPLELAARAVTVESLELLEVDCGEDHLDLRVDLRCGPGTYVRSIARDLGERLASGGYLAALRRTEAAGLRAEDALTPERLEGLAARGALASALIPIGDLLPLPRLDLASEDAARFRNGSTVAVRAEIAAGRSAVFTDGELLGVGRVERERLQPEKVLAEPMAAQAGTAAR